MNRDQSRHQSSGSNPKNQVKAETYAKYRDELEMAKKLHGAAVDKIRKADTPEDFMLIKSAEAEGRANLEETKSREKIEDKLEQIKIQFPGVEKELTTAEANFDEGLEEARDSFNEMLEQARYENEVSSNKDIPEEQVDDAKDTYEQNIKKGWETFKAEIRMGGGKRAAANFQREIDEARETFEEETKTEVDEFLEGVEGWAKEDYERAVENALEEFVQWVQSAVQYFCTTVDQLVESQKVKESKSKMEKKKNSMTVVAAGVKFEESSSEGCLTSSDEEKPAENLEDLSEDYEMTRRLDVLEGKMSEMVKTVNVMNERLASMEKTVLEQKERKKLFKSLETEMKEFRAARIKEIETIMAKIKEGNLNK